MAGLAVGGRRYQTEGGLPLAGALRLCLQQPQGSSHGSHRTMGEGLSLLWEISGYNTFFVGSAKSMGKDMSGNPEESSSLNQGVKANSREGAGLEAHLMFKSKKIIVQGTSTNPIPVSLWSLRSFTTGRIALPTYTVLQFDVKVADTQSLLRIGQVRAGIIKLHSPAENLITPTLF